MSSLNVDFQAVVIHQASFMGGLKKGRASELHPSNSSVHLCSTVNLHFFSHKEIFMLFFILDKFIITSNQCFNANSIIKSLNHQKLLSIEST